MTDADRIAQRERLVDHFKAAYQIVIGVAITIACTNLFADGSVKFPPDISFWTFCIFFITVMPIFHGGDRSLDVKYLKARSNGFWARVSYLWDFYALAITAILFVKVAQAIPNPGSTPASGLAGPTPMTPQHFYIWMAIAFGFDVIVLVIDGIKSDLFKIYGKWIAFNLILAAVCVWAWRQPDIWPNLSVNCTGATVFAFALLRTVLDYTFGDEFMFP